MKKHLLATFILVLSIIPALGQINNVNGINGDWDGTLDHVTRNNYLNRNLEKDPNDIVFFYYDFSSTRLSLRHFKYYNPEYKDLIPDYVDIKLPEIFAVEDTTVAVTYLVQNNKGFLVVMIIGDNKSLYPRHYIDDNMDYDFSNDGDPYVFDRNKTKKILLRNKEATFVFEIINPSDQKKVDLSEYYSKATKRNVDLSKINQKDTVVRLTSEKLPAKFFLFELMLFTGRGTAGYSYIQNVNGLPTNYSIDYNPTGFHLGIGYNFKGMEFMIFGSVESINYYTSRKEEYYAPGKYDLSTNKDAWPDSRNTFGLKLGYAFFQDKTVSLKPIVNFAMYNYNSNNQYIISRSTEESYTLVERYYLGVGGDISLKINRASALFFNITYRIDNFVADGFERSINGSQFNSSNDALVFGVGFKYRLIKK